MKEDSKRERSDYVQTEQEPILKLKNNPKYFNSGSG